MPDPQFIARNSTFFEHLLERRFLFDLQRELVLRDPPALLNVLKSEVDAFGFDLVLAVGGHSLHVQMKTRSGKPPPNPYTLSQSLWTLPNACAIWMLYDPRTIEPASYYLLGEPMPSIEKFPASVRSGFVEVKMQQCNHRQLTLPRLAELLFPIRSGGSARDAR